MRVPGLMQRARQTRVSLWTRGPGSSWSKLGYSCGEVVNTTLSSPKVCTRWTAHLSCSYPSLFRALDGFSSPLYRPACLKSIGAVRFQHDFRNIELKPNPKSPAPKQSTALAVADSRELVLSPPALVVTREYEWGNIIFGFEQANRYTIRSPGGQVAGYIAEEDSLGKSLVRNLLKTHRSFKATVLDPSGTPVLRVFRPFYWISTSLYVESPDGELLGEVQMRWHLYRRRYDLYVDKKQFASIDGGFLAWDFNMNDENGQRIASINKDFTGFARELFTDARQYVIRMDPNFEADISPDALRSEEYSDALNNKLSTKQRAVVLGCAISIDFDYFSLHSGSGGVVGPGVPFIMPIPGMSGGEQAPAPGTDTGAVPGAIPGAMPGVADSQPGFSSSTPSSPISSPESPDEAFPQSQFAEFQEHKPEFPSNNSFWGTPDNKDDDNDDGGDDGGDGGGSLIGSFARSILGIDDD